MQIVDDACAPVSNTTEGDSSFDAGDAWTFECSRSVTADDTNPLESHAQLQVRASAADPWLAAADASTSVAVSAAPEPEPEPEPQPVLPATGNDCVATGNETVQTDAPDYAPESIVHVTGLGYASQCDVRVEVTRPDGSIVHGDGSFSPGVDTATTSPTGTLVYDYQLDGILGIYHIRVLGAWDTVLAEMDFVDSPCAAISAVFDGVSTCNLSVNHPVAANTAVAPRPGPEPAHPRRWFDHRRARCELRPDGAGYQRHRDGHRHLRHRHDGCR